MQKYSYFLEDFRIFLEFSRELYSIFLYVLKMFVDMNVNYLTARGQAPSGGHTEAQIIETEDSNYSIRFVPKVIIFNFF